MLNAAAIESASGLLVRHRLDGTCLDALPVDLRPATRAEGYAIQAQLERRMSGPLFGWKIAATSRAGQAHIGVDGPLAGRLLSERVHPSGCSLALFGNHMRVAEPEFAFRMATTLPPRPQPYGTDEVMAAVGTLHPAIEVPSSRFSDFARAGAAQLLADNACAHQFVLGPAAEADWRGIDLARHRVVAKLSDGRTREGSGAAVLDDPRLALTWLANELRDQGRALRAGETVTTGTCMVPLEIQPGDSVTVDFGLLGSVGVRFVLNLTG